MFPLLLLGLGGVVLAVIALWPRETEADIPPDPTPAPDNESSLWTLIFGGRTDQHSIAIIDEWGAPDPLTTEPPPSADDRPWYTAIWDAIMPSSGPLTGTGLSEDENKTILLIANEVGIDARLLAAIRRAEMGGPGREFGVLSVSAPTYADQARVAARTIANNQQRYETATGLSATDPRDGRFTPQFIAYLGSKYAPINAANDPLGLNINWVGNVTSYYGRINYA